jgi:26S proteasome regulatory subunit N5
VATDGETYLSADSEPFSELLKSFITKELMRWPGVESLYGPTLRESDVFAPSSGAVGVEDAGTKRWENLHQRVIEHVRKNRFRATIY